MRSQVWVCPDPVWVRLTLLLPHSFRRASLAGGVAWCRAMGRHHPHCDRPRVGITMGAQRADGVAVKATTVAAKSAAFLLAGGDRGAIVARGRLGVTRRRARTLPVALGGSRCAQEGGVAPSHQRRSSPARPLAALASPSAGRLAIPRLRGSQRWHQTGLERRRTGKEGRRMATDEGRRRRRSGLPMPLPLAGAVVVASRATQDGDQVAGVPPSHRHCLAERRGNAAVRPCLWHGATSFRRSALPPAAIRAPWRSRRHSHGHPWRLGCPTMVAVHQRCSAQPWPKSAFYGFLAPPFRPRLSRHGRIMIL